MDRKINMRIVHLCLYGPVMDGWSYQDNMLSKYHRKLGYDVTLIASKWVWNQDNVLEKEDLTDYLNEDGVKVIRLDIKNNKNVLYTFKKYMDLDVTLEKENPDILFIHNAAYLDIFKVRRYLNSHPTMKVYVDNHNDFSNSAKNIISKYLLHKGIWRLAYKSLIPFVMKFYGVLPARVDFLINIYGIPKEKTELLVMGGDDDRIAKASSAENIRKIRKKHKIEETDFLIVTGGKIDIYKKQTILLMEAIKSIKNLSIKLILFGSISCELREQVYRLVDKDKIQYIGWIDANESYDYFAASDLVVFPGRHSVFWEQVAGQGIPMICKYWEGTTHIDVGGNVRFLKKDSVEEIKENIEEIVTRPGSYKKMKLAAQEHGREAFSYKNIAKRSIGLM